VARRGRPVSVADPARVKAGDPPPSGPSLAAYVRSLRPRQWLKNVLVFAAPIAAGDARHASTLAHAGLAFVAFCMGASATYLLNDARDVESDRRHPVKRSRPIAAGLVPIPAAYVMAGVLLVASIAVAFATTIDLGWTLLGYLALTTSYSLFLKREPILDIVAVAGCYVLRAVAGATATGLPISEWFFIVTSFGALMVVVGKRESELRALGDEAGQVRATLSVYTVDFLRYVRGVATGVVLVAYCLWAFESASHSDSSIWFQLSIVPFTTAILQYGLVLERGGGENPELVLTSDRAILVSGAVWAIVYAYAVYRA
jgi:decaprenyl-phosphate phosphoribosyltransferase